MKPVTHRLRIDLRPRADLEFRAALERASVAASLAGAELDTPEAARIVEDELRSDGYPSTMATSQPACPEPVNGAPT